jgi:hypothetical protein
MLQKAIYSPLGWTGSEAATEAARAASITFRGNTAEEKNLFLHDVWIWYKSVRMRLLKSH